MTHSEQPFLQDPPAGAPRISRGRRVLLVVVPLLVLAAFAGIVFLGYTDPGLDGALLLAALLVAFLSWMVGGRVLNRSRLVSCLGSVALVPGLALMVFGSVLLGPDLGHYVDSDRVEAKVVSISRVDGRVSQPDGTTSGIISRVHTLERVDDGSTLKVRTADVDLDGVDEGATVEVMVDPTGERSPKFAVSATPERDALIAAGGAVAFLLAWAVVALVGARIRPDAVPAKPKGPAAGSDHGQHESRLPYEGYDG